MVTVTLPGGSEIVGPTSFTVVEGETAVGTLMATDADTPAADLVWSTAGDADSGQFALDESGALRFAAPKDYEAPEDAGRDGTYELTELTAQASDGTDETAAAIREHVDDLEDVYLAEQRLVDLRLGKISRRPARRRDGARWRRRSSLTRPPYATWTSSTSSRGGGFSFFARPVATLDNPRSIGESPKGSTLREFWKYRVGDYRVIAGTKDRALCALVVKIGNRREVYR